MGILLYYITSIYFCWFEDDDNTFSSSLARFSTGSPDGNGVFLSTLYLNSSFQSIPRVTFLPTKVMYFLGTSNLLSCSPNITILSSVSFMTCPTWSSFSILTPLLKRVFPYLLIYAVKSTWPSEPHGSTNLPVGSGASRDTLYFFIISPIL